MDLLSAISAGLKVVGAFMSLVAGLTALYTPTEEKKLTSFGKGVLTALVVEPYVPVVVHFLITQQSNGTPLR